MLGIVGAVRSRGVKPRFHWGRAIVVGGVAGTLSGLVFSKWMYEGAFYPLLSGFGALNTRAEMVVVHFLIALFIGRNLDCYFRRMCGDSAPVWDGGWGSGFSGGFLGR